MVVNCIGNKFQQNDFMEALHKIEIMLLKASCEESFDHELQQMPSFFSGDINKFILETTLKTLTQIVDEKQVVTKDATKSISSLNASQKLLASEVLKLLKLKSTSH